MIQFVMHLRQRLAARAALASSVFLLLAPVVCNAQASRKSSIDLPNFAAVDPGLYRGAAPTPIGLDRLKAMGVGTVIDLRISPELVKVEAAHVRSLGMTFVNIPLGAEPATPSQQKQFLAAVTQASPARKVFVHCQHGADRTGEMIGLHRRIDDHWTYAQTYAEMRSFGFKPYYTQLAAVVKKASPPAQ